MSPGSTHNSQDQHSADVGESQLPEGYYSISDVLDHWPQKAGIENAKWYKIRWKENGKIDWIPPEDLTAVAIETYWENKITRRVKRRASKLELK